MQIDWFTFTAQIVNFLILIWLLRRFLYRPVVEAMDRREQKIAGRIDEARQKMVAAEEKEREYEQELDHLRKEKSRMMQEAKEEVEQTRRELLAEARSEVESIQKRWHEALEHEREGFMRELEKETGDRILGIVRKILMDLSDAELEEQAVKYFIGRLSELEDKSLERLTDAVSKGDRREIVVWSSFELDPKQQEEIRSQVDELTVEEPECRFEVSGNLGFGIELRAGGWRTGWNLSAYLRSLRNEMEQFFERRTRSGPVDTAEGRILNQH